MTDKQLYNEKNAYMLTRFSEVKYMDFYRDMFPAGSFEKEGCYEEGKANGILTYFEGEKARNRIIFDDLQALKEVKDKDFVILSPVAYFGRNRRAENARWLYGIAIDLDGVEMQNLIDTLYQMKNGIIPQCTYCINSGHGLHLYYLFKEPIPLYRHLQEPLRELKHELTYNIWNRYTSTLTERDQVQYQGIFQGFRMVGSRSKLGKRYPVRAFKVGDKVDIAYLNSFVNEKVRVSDFDYKPNLSLEQAKKKYPEWYDRRIVKGEPRGRWNIKRDLYDWWLRKIREGTKVGHRYSCLTVLASYAIKCNIDEDELMSDAMELLPFLDRMSDTEDNRFTKKDVMAALNFYQDSYTYYPRSEVERVSGISVPPNKRNGRKQDKHLQLARGIREIKMNMGEKVSGGGRPTAKDQVIAWRKENPDGRKADCIRETGLDKKTVYRWWKEYDEMMKPFEIHEDRDIMTQLMECERQGKRSVVMIPADEEELDDEEDYIEEEETDEEWDEYMVEMLGDWLISHTTTE